jgi:hypothetical protein
LHLGKLRFAMVEPERKSGRAKLTEAVNVVMAAATREAMQRIEGCSVGFLQLFEDDVEPLGSGTLVRIGNFAGIITAAHVWNGIAKRKLTRVGFY